MRASDENRSMALAVATAAGSGGQVVGAPLAEWLLTFMDLAVGLSGLYRDDHCSTSVFADDSLARPGLKGGT